MEVVAGIALGVGLVLICVLAWAANLIALPGNWFAVGVVSCYAWLGPEEGRLAMGWQVPAISFVLAAIGELWEFVAGAFGAKRAGASRRATMLAVVGSMVGALVGAVVGVPIPVIGQVVAALLFGALGAMGGAIYGEWTDGKNWRDSWTVGHAAFWGRLLGTLGKVLSGLAIVVLVAASLLV